MEVFDGNAWLQPTDRPTPGSLIPDSVFVRMRETPFDSLLDNEQSTVKACK